MSSGQQIHHLYPKWTASNKHPELFPGLESGHGFPACGPHQPPHVGLRSSGSGVTTRGGVSRTFPDLERGDLGEKARKKLSERSCGPTPRANLSEAEKGQDMAQWILAPAQARAPSIPTQGIQRRPSPVQHPPRNKAEKTKPKSCYGSSVDLVADTLDGW